MGDKKQLLVNMVASMINFLVSIGIGLILTPYVVHCLGAEAYGFVGLANTFVSYAQLLTIALNSVAGRFIAVSYHRGNIKQANRYYSSTLVADTALAAVLTLIAVPVIIFLDKLVNISPSLVVDVKTLFTFIFLNFIISTVATVYTIATFVKNKLYLSSLANLAFSVVRVVVMVLLFGILPPKVYYVGFAVCLGTTVMTVMNRAYTRVLLPDVSFHKLLVSWKSILEMLSEGMWSAVSKLQNILMFGIQLLVANLMVSPYLMGMLSIAQTIPNQINNLMWTVAGLFNPELTRYYAQNKRKELIEDIKFSMKVTGFFVSAIFVILFVGGYDFMFLWQHGQDTKLLYELLTLTMLGLLVSGVATSLQGLPLIVNKLKLYSIGWLCYSSVSMIVLFLLVKIIPDWGVFVIAAIPPIFEIIANVTFVPIYVSKCLGVKKTEFYPVYIRYFISAAVGVFVCTCIKYSFGLKAHSWWSLILLFVLYGIVAMCIDLIMLFSKKERFILWGILKKKISAFPK